LDRITPKNGNLENSPYPHTPFSERSLKRPYVTGDQQQKGIITGLWSATMTSTTTTTHMTTTTMMIRRTESADSSTSIESSSTSNRTTTKKKKKPGDVVHCPPFGDGKVLQVSSSSSSSGCETDDNDEEENTACSIIYYYKVRLAFGTLYASEQGLRKMNATHHKEWKTKMKLQQKQQKGSSKRGTKHASSSSKSAAAEKSNSSRSHNMVDNNNDTTDDSSTTDPGATMALNVAYEALETMRKLNLELTCQEMDVAFDATKCTRCLLGRHQQHSSSSQQQSRSAAAAAAAAASAKKGTPCFICASPTCKTHSCATFRKEGNNTVCQDCKHLYSLDYVLAILTMATRSGAENDIAQTTCSQLLARMLDTYDRTVLVLKYSAQFMPDLCQQLENAKSLKNKVGIGSSSVGLMSGSLGIAATACLLTPVSAVFAPPLIIASILCGGTSSALQTGVEMSTTTYSEAHQLATRIIALYGMCKSILRTVSVLQDLVDMLQRREAQMLADGKVMKLLNNNNNSGDAANCFAANHETARLAMMAASTTTTTTTAMENGVSNDAQTNKAFTTTTTTTRTSTTTTSSSSSLIASNAEVGSAAGKNARFITRSGASSVSMSSNVVSAGGNTLSAGMMTAAQFATFAGGALSAAVLVCEAHTMTQTIIDMRNGSKCPKADLLRQILRELNILPTTMEVDRQAHDATQVLTTSLVYPCSSSSRRMSMEDAKQLLIDLLGPEQVPNYVDDLKKLQKQQSQSKNQKKFLRGYYIDKLRNSRNEKDNDARIDDDDDDDPYLKDEDDDDDVATNEMRSFVSVEKEAAKDSSSASGVAVGVDSETSSSRRGASSFWRAWSTTTSRSMSDTSASASSSMTKS
jgi:hypothetical protein